MIKVILLDIDNTLLDFHACAGYAMDAAAEQLDLLLPAGTFEAFQRFNRLLWGQVEQGELTAQRLFEIRWNLIFQEVGVRAEGQTFEEEFLRWLRISAVPVDGALELLQYLHGKYTLCAASNAPYQQQVRRLERAGMLHYMDQLFISEEIGASKPSRAFFDTCLQRLGDVCPDEIMMIGDSLKADMVGGRGAGLHTCWYNYTGMEVTDRDCADHIVRRLCEVRAFL